MKTKRIIGLVVAAVLLALPAVSAQQPQSMPVLQTFDQGIPSDWDFSCNRSLIASNWGSAMRIWGGGHAILPMPPQDFALNFQFRSAGGAGDIGFNFTDHNNSIDTITLEPQRVILSRRTQVQPGQFQHTDYASGFATLGDGLWHAVTVQYRNGRVDVWVDQRLVINYQHYNRLPAGAVGLGVIANSGNVDFDNVSYGPASQPTPPSAVAGTTTPPTTTPPTTTPPTTTPPTQQMMITPPPGPPGQSVVQVLQTDLALSDIYATQLRNGQLYVRITNRGPQPLTQQQVQLECNIGGSMSLRKFPLTLAVGQTTNHLVGPIDTSTQGVTVRATITAIGLADSDSGNNYHEEQIPQATFGGQLPTDLTVSDILATKNIQGQVVVSVTNRGPVNLTGPIELLLNVNAQNYPVEQYVVPLKVNETRQIHTNVTIDASQGDQSITATVRRPGIHDTNQSNNSHQETVPRVQGGGATAARDLAITHIFLQGSTAPVGWQSVRFVVANQGSLTVIGDANLSFTVNNGPAIPVTAKLALPPGESMQIATEHRVYDNQLPVTIQAQLNLPGFADNNMANNTLTKQLAQ